MRKALAVVTVLVLVFVAVGLMLPGDYRVERSALVPAERAAVFAAASDLTTWPNWSTWSAAGDPSCTFEFTGGTEGAPVSAIEWRGDAHGHGRLEFLEVVAPERIDFVLTSFRGDRLVRSSGTLSFAPEAGGTRVTWSLVGQMPREPVQRWVGLMMDGALGPHFEKTLAGLAAQFSAP